MPVHDTWYLSHMNTYLQKQPCWHIQRVEILSLSKVFVYFNMFVCGQQTLCRVACAFSAHRCCKYHNLVRCLIYFSSTVHINILHSTKFIPLQQKFDKLTNIQFCSFQTCLHYCVACKARMTYRDYCSRRRRCRHNILVWDWLLMHQF